MIYVISAGPSTYIAASGRQRLSDALVLSWCSRGALVVLAWCSRGARVVLAWCSRGARVALPED
jgi:hypothetical protein